MKLAKLEEMNTWSDIEESDVHKDKQILPGMWVHLMKNLESGEKEIPIKMGSERGSTKDEPVSE